MRVLMVYRLPIMYSDGLRAAENQMKEIRQIYSGIFMKIQLISSGNNSTTHDAHASWVVFNHFHMFRRGPW